jgi:murein L,D-transpeptidase YafK
MRKRDFLAGLAGSLAAQPALAANGLRDRLPVWNGKVYSGPKVTQLLLYKGRRKLYLLHEKDVIKSYRVQLGFNPNGHKQHQGDGRTPEGLYFLDRRNFNSRYHLSLGISYPNSRDIARARAAGKPAGGDIFIHGGPRSEDERRKRTREGDWTAGCIALKDRDVQEVFWMTELGVPIFIRA